MVCASSARGWTAEPATGPGTQRLRHPGLSLGAQGGDPWPLFTLCSPLGRKQELLSLLPDGRSFILAHGEGRVKAFVKTL